MIISAATVDFFREIRTGPSGFVGPNVIHAFS
jgi:hypothetical protein